MLNVISAAHIQTAKQNQVDPGFLTSNWETLAVPLTVSCVALLLYRYLFDEDQPSSSSSSSSSLPKRKKSSTSSKKKRKRKPPSNDNTAPLQSKDENENSERIAIRQIAEDLLSSRHESLHRPLIRDADDDDEDSSEEAESGTKLKMEETGNLIQSSLNDLVQTETVEPQEEEEEELFDFDQEVESKNETPKSLLDVHDLSSRFDNSDQCSRCKVVFSMFNRRHHCRKCFKSVCHACSGHTALLPEIAGDEEQRICDDCFVIVRK